MLVQFQPLSLVEAVLQANQNLVVPQANQRMLLRLLFQFLAEAQKVTANTVNLHRANQIQLFTTWSTHQVAQKVIAVQKRLSPPAALLQSSQSFTHQVAQKVIAAVRKKLFLLAAQSQSYIQQQQEAANATFNQASNQVVALQLHQSFHTTHRVADFPHITVNVFTKHQ